MLMNYEKLQQLRARIQAAIGDEYVVNEIEELLK